MIQLRPYQEELIAGVRQHFRAGRKRVLLQSATGSGKTAMCSRMLHNAAERGKRVWFLCHRRELVAQIAKALKFEGVDFGLVTADARMNLSAPAQICSIPTLANRIDRLPPPDLIAWDEVHHLMSGSWEKIALAFPDAHHVGLSATPIRLDGAGLGNFFEAMVCGPSVKWLMENGFLSQYRMFAPSTVDRSGLHTRMGEFIKSETNELMSKPKIVGSAVGHYRKHIDGARAIVFCASIERSLEMAARFNDANIPAMHIDGKTDDWIREGALDDLAEGKLRIITQVEIFGEGVDCPVLDAVIDLSPTASLSRYLQRAGRMMRLFPGKEFGYYLDCCGNAELHGLPDDDREWPLLTGVSNKQKPDVPPPRICPTCYAANRSGATVCKVCKSPFPVESRQVDQVDGELSEVAAAKRTAEAEEIRKKMTHDRHALIGLARMRKKPNPEKWADWVLAQRNKSKRTA